MYPEYDPFQGILVDPVEKTPSMHEPKVEEEYPKGIYRNCYVCGILAESLPQNAVVSLAYEKARTQEEIRARAKPSKYVLTYCQRCYKSFIENKSR